MNCSSHHSENVDLPFIMPFLFYFIFMDSNRVIRLSMGGWVAINSPNSARGDGDAINMDAMDLVLFWFDSDD